MPYLLLAREGTDCAGRHSLKLELSWVCRNGGNLPTTLLDIVNESLIMHHAAAEENTVQLAMKHAGHGCYVLYKLILHGIPGTRRRLITLGGATGYLDGIGGPQEISKTTTALT